jgi:arylsulfatase A-like enzyme
MMGGMNRPNVLFLLVDDLGWKDVGCFGSEFYETPNIDALAGESMRFTDGYASCPVCSPTRASILTGKYPASLGLTNYIDWHWRIHPRKGKLIDAPYIRQLPHDQRTLAEAFGSHGWRTAHVGKWHLGPEAHYPQHHGFETNIGGCEWGLPMHGYFSPWRIPGVDDSPEGTYLTDYLTDAAIRWIDSEDDRPFFLNLWYYAVHTPIQAKRELVEKYRKKAEKLGLADRDPNEFLALDAFDPDQKREILVRTIQSYPAYAAMVETLDENIGKIIAHLKGTGQWNNTITVFTSDNGGLSSGRNGGVTSNAPLLAGKGWMYEGGTRVSTIVRAPGITEPGSTCDQAITSPDFYPTLLDAADLPLEPAHHTDGVSLRPLLRGDGRLKRDAIFWHFPHYSNMANRPGCSVRMGHYKLIEFFEDGHLELYNLREDIGENHNLAEQEPERRDMMMARLQAWKEQVCARIPRPNPEWPGGGEN